MKNQTDERFYPTKRLTVDILGDSEQTKCMSAISQVISHFSPEFTQAQLNGISAWFQNTYPIKE